MPPVWGFGESSTVQQKREMEESIHNVLREIAENTESQFLPDEGDPRWHQRSNRSLPALLVPWENGGPMVQDATYALTKDFSSQGLALILPHPFRVEAVLIGLHLDTPLFALGQIRHNAALGGGFWQLGIQIYELIEVDSHPHLPTLLPLAERLVPCAVPASLRSNS